MNKYPSLVPKIFCTTPVTVYVRSERVNKYGQTEEYEVETKCNYQAKAKTILQNDNRVVNINGSCFFDGDILEEVDEIVDGEIEFTESNNPTRRKIVSCVKARNLDGSVNYTQIDIE